MCTVILLHRVHPELPLVVAANRDELYARPTRSPELLHRAPRAIGGLDLFAGGTWMGATETGLFAGLTNQPTGGERDAARRSRGEVVLGALEHRDRRDARAYLTGLDGRDYNPFNLVFGDAGGLEVAYARPERRALELAPVPEGVHVLPNGRLDAPAMWKVEHVRARVEPLSRLPWDRLRPALIEVLADHDKPPAAEAPQPPADSRLPPEILRELQATCVHTPGYGTRSSTVLALEQGRVACYLYADGPPCRTELEDVTRMLRG